MADSSRAGQDAVRPWYREPWPWIIIGMLGTVILASLATLWIAVTHPDPVVVDDREYQELRRGLRAQNPPPTPQADEAAPEEG